MSLPENPPLFTNINKTDLQQYFVCSFMSPEDKEKKHVFNKINKLLDTKINCEIKKITDDLIVKILKQHNNKVNCSILNFDFNKNNLLIDYDSFINEYKYHYFNNTIDDQIYYFNDYCETNYSLLNENYKTKYGNNVNTFGLKIIGVCKDLNKLPMYKTPSQTSIYPVHVGRWACYNFKNINNPNYEFKQEYIDEFIKIFNQYKYEKLLDNENFNNRVNQSKTPRIIKND